MLRWCFAAALLTGCGRIAFDERGPDGGADAAADATGPRCGEPASGTSRVVVSGQTFRYTQFDNTSTPVDTVDVSVAIGSIRAGMTSDANGAYRVEVPTEGTPGVFAMTVGRTGYFTTRITTDLLVGSDQMGMRLDPVMRLGDAPIWQVGSMGVIYNTAGLPYDAARGTLNIGIRDCAGNPVPGVSVSLTPPPDGSGRLFYQAIDGTAGNTTATVGPFTHAIALGVRPGPVTIHASGGGKTFEDQTVMVLDGSNNTLTILHGSD